MASRDGPTKERVVRGGWKSSAAVATLVMAVGLCTTGVLASAKARSGWLAIGVTYRIHDGGTLATVGHVGPNSSQVPGDRCGLSWMTDVTPVGRTLGHGTLVRVGDGYDGDWPYDGDSGIKHCSAGSLAFVETIDPKRDWPTPAELDEREAARLRAEVDRKAKWGHAADQAVSCGKAGDCPGDAGE